MPLRLKDWALFSLLAVVGCCQGSLLGAPRQRLDVRTLADWSIVVDPAASASEKYAAEEFRDFLAQSIGHQLPLCADGTAGTNNVFIGASTPLRNSNLSHVLNREYAAEELRIAITLDNIAIVGGRPRGVLYGVYQFLEDVLRVRFLAPQVTHVPRYTANDTDLRRGQQELVDYSYQPPIDCRYVAFKDLPGHTGQFAARLRANGRYSGDDGPPGEWRQKIGFNNRQGVFLHNIGKWVPFQRETHPQHFAADGSGKRGHSPQPCFSDPAVIQGITQKVLSQVRDYAPRGLLPIAHADATLCYCGRCQDIIRKDGREPDGPNGEALGAPMFLAVNHIARQVAKIHPEVTIGTYAYTASAVPPLNIKMEPNVRVQYATYNACQIHPFDSLSCPQNMRYLQDMRQWSKISQGMMYWYYGMGTFTDYFAPPLVLRMAGPHVRTMVANNAKSIFIQGGQIVWTELVQYVYARLLWNPRLGTYELINEFLDLYYGKAAGPIAEFLRLADQELRRAGNHPGCNGPDIFKAYNYSQGLGRRGLQLFAKALVLADSPELKARVEKASLSAHRLSLGATWLGETPPGMSATDKAEYRQSARKVFELCQKFNLVSAHEGRRLPDVEKAIRRALAMPADEPF